MSLRNLIATIAVLLVSTLSSAAIAENAPVTVTVETACDGIVPNNAVDKATIKIMCTSTAFVARNSLAATWGEMKDELRLKLCDFDERWVEIYLSRYTRFTPTLNTPRYHLAATWGKMKWARRR
ncbi:hypothetical protein CL629_04810 [bacterium]|nr:hypothetical protein [bacterium]|tara:strand:+ start:1177 stop:1548 length:372 start_codon:yes stop_codon:yes gene_type:complete